MEQSVFILDRTYQRSRIHDLYGGNRQSGISVSAKEPYIFIFSGQAGHQHGYKDQWENENVFSYTGEGQINDMRFIKGNLALRDHLRNDRRVFLFTHGQKSFVKFEGELELIDLDFFAGPDREGKERTAIKFFFKRVNVSLDYSITQLSLSLIEDVKQYIKLNVPNETEKRGLVTSRVGQGAYRKSVLYRWDFKCAVTNYSKNEILIASHIVPWRDSSNDERLDVNNGILLSPNYDALFDRHLISFENTGKIILSDSLSNTKYQNLGVTGKEVIRNLSEENQSYLERHRKILL